MHHFRPLLLSGVPRSPLLGNVTPSSRAPVLLVRLMSCEWQQLINPCVRRFEFLMIPTPSLNPSRGGPDLRYSRLWHIELLWGRVSMRPDWLGELWSTSPASYCWPMGWCRRREQTSSRLRTVNHVVVSFICASCSVLYTIIWQKIGYFSGLLCSNPVKLINFLLSKGLIKLDRRCSRRNCRRRMIIIKDSSHNVGLLKNVVSDIIWSKLSLTCCFFVACSRRKLYGVLGSEFAHLKYCTMKAICAHHVSSMIYMRF